MRVRGASVAGLQGRTARLLGVEVRAVDALILSAFLLFGLLITVFHGRVQGPGALLLRTMVSGAVYFAAVAAAGRAKRAPFRWFLRTAAIQLLCAQLFLISQRMQLIWVPTWRDPALLRLEQSVFGVQPTVWLQRFVTPALTEWMFFAYVIYLVIYPGLSGLIFAKRGEAAMEDYLFHLAVVNISCFLLFFVFPVAGPLYFRPEAYAVPLQGGVFAAVGEYIRKNIHEIGGNLPSPHCAVATVMWALSYRYVRPVFYALAPVILSLYVSTFFLRYHYVSDSVAGILTGVLVVLAVPGLMKLWNAAVEPKPRTVP
jgi:hypothetical protein